MVDPVPWLDVCKSCAGEAFQIHLDFPVKEGERISLALPQGVAKSLEMNLVSYVGKQNLSGAQNGSFFSDPQSNPRIDVVMITVDAGPKTDREWIFLNITDGAGRVRVLPVSLAVAKELSGRLTSSLQSREGPWT